MIDFDTPHSTHRKANILCVDDDPHQLAELTETLAGAGFECHCCSDTWSALADLARQTPDLVIADINLGGESGLELCESIRRTTGLSEVPVIFLSGAEIPDIVRRSHQAGGQYYVRKPFDAEVLLELVDKALWLPHVAAMHSMN